MQRQITLSQQVFFLGLFLMLGAGIMSTMFLPAGGLGLPVLMLISGGIALAARLWHHRTRRKARRMDTLVGLGGYPSELLRDPRFISRSRPTR